MSFSFAVYRPSPGRVFERIVALFGLIVLIPASFAPPAYATAVGATPGSHQVSPSGAFTYTIPIAVPPGTAGIEPKLSLSYNSQGGNGLLGMGWSLAGLSVIHRCPKTMVQDGVIGGVNYNANDRYCLDGQRLVAVSGTYGADATEYRTESESYSRIVSYGSQGSGPAWWKVWTKSGQILEYGNTADSRIEAQGKTEVMLWSLNKLSGTVINYMPGINATGVLHDTWWNPTNGQPGSMFGFRFNAVTNWGTMLPAAAVTFGALLNNSYAGQTVVLDRMRK
ncbi:MAG: hypothetical protein IE917_15100 [Betaproteobacteria bacterium]|nr:hypothetical protein [Betaproteobacteria bacterium]